MKRIIICGALFLGAVVLSIYTYYRVDKLNETLDMRIDALTAVLHEGNKEEIIEQSKSLVEYWDEEEKTLVHFLRHTQVDIISVSMARLPALAEYEDYTEVYAELLSIRRQMEHIHKSESLTLYNLL